jgi:hypothetical protein
LEVLFGLPVYYCRAFSFTAKWAFTDTAKGSRFGTQVARVVSLSGYWSLWALRLSIAWRLFAPHFLLVGFTLSFIDCLFPNIIFPLIIRLVVTTFHVKPTTLYRSKSRMAILALPEQCQFPVKDMYKIDDFKWTTERDVLVSGLRIL